MFGFVWRPGRLEEVVARSRAAVLPLLILIDHVHMHEGVVLEQQMSQRYSTLRSISAKYAPILRQQCEQMGMNVNEIQHELQQVTEAGDPDKLQQFLDFLREKYGELIQNAMQQISLDPKQISSELLAKADYYPKAAKIHQDGFGNVFMDNSNLSNPSDADRATRRRTSGD